MGFRFRRSVKIAPGVRLNFSRSGVSTSIGGPGATVNLSKRGARGTVGLPGTGLSYSAPLSGQGAPQPAGGSSSGLGCAILAGLGVLLLAIGKCASSYAPPDASKSAGLSAPVGTATVAARSLNCRASADGGAAPVMSFRRGAAVAVAEESGEWTRVESGGRSCWVASRFLTARSSAASAGGASDGSGGGGEGADGSSSGTGLGHVARDAAIGGATLAGSSHRARSRSHRRSTRRTYYDESCPCSGSKVCIGPRGGRYCITSGGNKRYGI